MLKPSVKTLTKAFGIDAARKVRKALEAYDAGDLSPLESRLKDSDIPGTLAWIRKCYNRPREAEILEHACDELIGGFGTEVLIWDGMWPAWSYVNAGDTYDPTLTFEWSGCSIVRVRVECWGDRIEALERKGARNV